MLKINKVSLNVANSKYMKFHHISILPSMIICNTAKKKKTCAVQRHLHHVFCLFLEEFVSDEDDFVN